MSAGCSSETVQNSQPGASGSAANAMNSSPTPTVTATPSAPANAAQDETAEDNAEFAGTAGITEKKNAGISGVATMNAVRTARHGNYDRVVFEFAGAEMPTYHIEYIDKPVRTCDSGDVVPLAGDGWLEVRFTPARAYDDNGNATIPDRERSPNLPIVKEMKITCDFEADLEWVLGVSSPNRYRVVELKNPTRLVVDIKHK